MTRVVSPQNINEWTNLSEGIDLLPVRRSLAANLGLFQPEYMEGKTFLLPVTSVNDYKMVDIPWGTRVKNLQRDNKARLQMSIPHFAIDDSVAPGDIQGKIAFDDFLLQSRSETVESFMDKKKEKARQTVMNTWNDAFMHLIKTGTAYAPNGTVVNNYFTAFGVTQSVLNLDLTPTENPKTSIQAIIDNITDNFKGGFVPTRRLALCGRNLFDALASHPFVLNSAAIYKEDTMSVEMLTGILGTQGFDLNARYQAFSFGGVVWVRCDSEEEMPVDEARVFPTDLPDLFKVFFAPSDLTFDTINSPAQAEYYFELARANRTGVDFSYESNFLVGTLWPKAIVKVVAVYGV